MAVIAALALLALPIQESVAAPLTYPVTVGNPWPVPAAPNPTAPSWILYDATASAPIASENADDRRSIASVTKIMTGLLVVEMANMEDEVQVSANAAATGEKEIDLVAGETVTVSELFKALMIHSANDAATALAEHIAGSVGEFVDLMNERARELGLSNTSFANPHGLDEPGAYSSANDVLVMTQVAMANPTFAETVGTRSYVFPPDPDGNVRLAQSTNLLLGQYEGMAGVKTGFTFQALFTFSAAAERDGRVLIAVVLGSEGRRQHFEDARVLLDYGFDRMPYYAMLGTGNPYVSQEPRVSPSPRSVARDAETLLHLASGGLLLEQPGPILTGEEPAEPEPVVETVRNAEPGPASMWDMVTHWFTDG